MLNSDTIIPKNLLVKLFRTFGYFGEWVLLPFPEYAGDGGHAVIGLALYGIGGDLIVLYDLVCTLGANVAANIGAHFFDW